MGCTYGRPVTGTNLTILKNRARIVSVGRDFAPTLLQACSRVIASASITLLILTASLWDRGTLRRSLPTQTNGEASIRRRRGCLAARLMVVIIAMIAINLIGAVFRPIADRYRVAIVGLVLLVFLSDWVSPTPAVARGAVGIARHRLDRPEPCRRLVSAFV